jgi:prevent-host-death family protein
MYHIWQLQEAKSKLSELVNKALQEGPQIITRHGDEVAVVMSYEDFNRLRKPETSLVEFLRSSPLAGFEIDLERDRSSFRPDVEL